MFSLPKEQNIVRETVLPFEFKDKSELLTSTDAVIIDDYDSQDFNRNDCGWIRNDISQLMRAQSRDEYDMLLKRLDVRNESDSLPKDMPKSEAIKRIKPRYAQSVVELEQYAEQLANIDMAKVDEAYRKALDGKVVASTDASETTPAATPAATPSVE